MTLRWLAGGAVVIGLWLASVGAVSAQPAASPPLPTTRKVPPLPEPKPFTELFRKLLAATPAEHEALLAGRSPESRAVLVKKLDEYRSLPAPKREAKLAALDLRWYLMVALPMPPAQRPAWIARIPEKDRAIVRERLDEWERLPENLQQELLDDNRAATVLSRRPFEPGSTDSSNVSRIPASIERAVADWRTLPSPQQERIAEHIRNEQRLFDGLSDTQRDHCLRAFQKYTRLSQQDRARFLQNAERWRTMTPKERLIWRSLAVPVTPPLPPTRSLPPLPK